MERLQAATQARPGRFVVAAHLGHQDWTVEDGQYPRRILQKCLAERKVKGMAEPSITTSVESHANSKPLWLGTSDVPLDLRQSV